MFSHLQIYDPRERVLVGLADAGLALAAAVGRLRPVRRASRPAKGTPPRRILLLRLERIGDLLMSAPAIAAVRQFAPDATIDLVVGSWNTSMARLIPGIDRVETLDASWLARRAGGGGMRALMAHARGWRTRKYDLAINFEGDIRSHALLALSGAPERAGFTMAGGGPLLTRRFDFDPTTHTTANAWRLVQGTFDALGVPRVHQAPADAADASEARGTATLPFGLPPFRLALPALARERAAALLGREARVIGLHASGGRAIKQWVPARFADAAARIASSLDATLVLTGSPADRPIVDAVRAALPPDLVTIDLSGELELPILGAVIERCQLYVTGDTGPMHLAAAVGTPTVAVFGPSDPARYAPLSTAHRVVRIDLPCAPCNRIRLPPTRCQGHTPDCLEGITADMVVRAALELHREEEQSPSPPLPPLSPLMRPEGGESKEERGGGAPEVGGKGESASGTLPVATDARDRRGAR